MRVKEKVRVTLPIEMTRKHWHSWRIITPTVAAFVILFLASLRHSSKSVNRQPLIDFYDDPLELQSMRQLDQKSASMLAKWPHCDGRKAAVATVVSSMIILPKGSSKHATEKYVLWLSNMLESVSSPLVLFLSNFPGGESRVRNIRGDKPLLVINVESTWDLPRARELREEYEGRQYSLDAQKKIHSPELYAIWNGKVDMLANASAENYFCSHYFLWVDGGSFRERVFHNWPAPERVAAAFSVRPQGMLFSMIGYYSDAWKNIQALALEKTTYEAIAEDRRWNAAENPAFLVDRCLQGGFLGGNEAAIQAYAREFRAHLLHQIGRGRFIGVDQINFSILFAETFHDGPSKGKHAVIQASRECTSDIW